MKKNYIILCIISSFLFACGNSQKTKELEAEKMTNEMNEANQLKLKNMKGFEGNIEKAVEMNNNFRKVLYTGKHMQLVLMCLKPSEEIGEETHKDIDQFFRFESGTGKCFINGNAYNVAGGDVIIVPAGAKHNVINTDVHNDLKMYTIYSPPNHQDGIVRATRKEAETNEEVFDGKTTE